MLFALSNSTVKVELSEGEGVYLGFMVEHRGKRVVSRRSSESSKRAAPWSPGA